MVNVLKNILNIKMTITANRFIYYFKRIWLIGKIIPDSVYADGALKSVLSWIVFVLKQLSKFLTRSLYVGIAMFLPLFMVYEETALSVGFPYFVHIFFMMTVLIGGISDSEIFKSSSEKFICLKYMRMNPKLYVKASLALKYILDFIYFLPSIIISVLLLGGSFLNALVLCVLMTSFRFIFELIHLTIYEKFNVIIPRKNIIIWPIIGLALAGAYVPVFLTFEVFTMDVVLSIPFVLSALILGAICFYYVMFKYDKYTTVVPRTLDTKLIPQVALNEAKSAKFNDVKIKDKDLKQSYKIDKHSSKTGYSYLNAVFFDRHKRQITNPLLIRLSIVGAAFLVFLFAYAIYPQKSQKIASSITNTLPIFVFIMYLMSTTNKACRAMFYNCDISLLRYGFYRKPNIILKNFKTRLFKLASQDILVGVAISTAVVLIANIAKVEWKLNSMIPFIATILLLSVFFTVHHLFMYYVFQPYTTQLDVKNPFFNIINGVVYFISYMCLQIDKANTTFTFIVFCSTIIYIVVALILVFKFSPKTFRVK